MTMPVPLRVCYFGTYRAEYARNRILIEGLQRAGVQVITCHVPLWIDIQDRVNIASGGWFRPAFWGRLFRTYWKLLQQYQSIGIYDILIVGYPGQYDVFLARWLSWMRRKPLVWDVLNSMYLIMSERGIAGRHRFTAGVVRWLEVVATRLPDAMILDTDVFIEWFQKTLHSPKGKFRTVPIGADLNELPEALMQVSSILPPDPTRDFIVIYYGTYIPNHGVETIVRAAAALKTMPHIRFEMIGVGPERVKAENLAKEHRLENVQFIDWLEKPELAAHIARAGVCLGSLGDTLQANLTNNNKIYEAFSLKIPAITGQSPALPKSLIHRHNVYLVERGNPQALADAIIDLKDNEGLRQSLAINGYQLLRDLFDITPLGELYRRHLEEIQATYDH